MKKTCSKCSQEFECQSDKIQSCHCQQVTLSKNQQEKIHEKYRDCLCPKCLKGATQNQT